MVLKINKQRVVIKVGSSSLTNEQGDLDFKKIKKMIDEIVVLKNLGYEVILVSSGAVAAGYRKLGCLQPPKSVGEKQAAASIGQGILIESYARLFSEKGYHAGQLLITPSDFLDEVRYNNIRNTINILLEKQIIPIINENDSVSIEQMNFGDNDTLAAKVAGLLDADQLLLLSDIDGLYNQNPKENADAKLIKYINEISPEVEAMASGSSSHVGTGGMKTKIEAARIALSTGIVSFVGNASTPSIISNAVKGKAKGTYFVPKKQNRHLSHRKKWIAFNSNIEGVIVINQQSQYVPSFNSFYLKDILGIKGVFEESAVVKIEDQHGKVVGKGIVAMSSTELSYLLEGSRKRNSSYSILVVNVDEFVCVKDVPSLVGV